MNRKRIGRRTVALEHPPSVISYANIGGKLEGEGPLREHLDELDQGSFFGEKTWEKAESAKHAQEPRCFQRDNRHFRSQCLTLDFSQYTIVHRLNRPQICIHCIIRHIIHRFLLLKPWGLCPQSPASPLKRAGP